MRSTRIVMYRKKYKKGIIVVQILFILYAALISISQLTSSTSAFFNHTKAVSISIPTGSWWDGSDLLFIGKGNQNLNDACPPVEFSVEIKNNGYSMIASTNYEVFYIENGNPENGEKISEGTLEPIKAGEVATISYQAEEEGFYAVKAFQQPNYEGAADEVIWSEKIKVKCPEKEKEKEKQSDKNESLESNEEVLEETKDPEETNEISEEASQEQKEQEEQESSTEDEEKLDTSAETDSEKEPMKSEQEDKQESSNEPNKETDDKSMEAENKKTEKDKSDESEEQENSQTDQAKEGEQE